MTQGIFISYRRSTGSPMARMIYDRLRLEKKYPCFLDVETLNAGDYRENIAAEMERCDTLVLILSRDALARCSDPDDTVRLEIETALERGLSIIPVTAEDFVWPEKMPQGLERLATLNAIPYVQVYSGEFFERLYSFIDAARGGSGRARGGKRLPWVIGAAALIALIAVLAAVLPGRNRADGKESAPDGETAPAAAFALPLSVRTEGTLAEDRTLAVFHTGSADGTRYYVWLQNHTAPSDVLTGTLLDGEGREILPAETNADSGDGSLTAYWGGTTCYGAYDGLRGDTDYYIRLRGADGTDYSLAAFPEGAEPPDAVPRLRLQAGDSCAITTDQDSAPLIALNTKFVVSGIEGYEWLAFETGAERGPYFLALQNRSADGAAAQACLFDSFGRPIDPAETNSPDTGCLSAGADGGTRYDRYDSLAADTVYFIRLTGGSASECSLFVSTGDGQPIAEDPRAQIARPEDFYSTFYQDGAPLIAADTTYEVHFSGGYTWSAFATGGDDRAVYRLALQNNTGDGETLYGRLMDQYGREVFPAETNTADAYGLCAQPDGTPVYGLYRGLRPDTVYFIRIEKNGEASYYLEVAAYVAAEQ